MDRRPILPAVALAVMALVAGGAAMATTAHAATGVIRADAPGKANTAPGAIAQRAISLSPHLTELMFAAGAGKALVGVAAASNYPPQAASLPQVGDGARPNIERIVLLNPDLILAWGYNLDRTRYPALANLRVPILYQHPTGLDDIIHDIRQLGARFGTQRQAGATADQLRSILDATRKQYEHAQPVRVFILVSQQPLYTLGAQSFVVDALHACGAVSVFEELSTPAPVVSVEQLLRAQPQAVLFGSRDAQDATATRRFLASRGVALPASRFLAEDPDILFRPTDRLIRHLPQLCARLAALRQAAAPTPSGSPLPPQRHRP